MLLSHAYVPAEPAIRNLSPSKADHAAWYVEYKGEYDALPHCATSAGAGVVVVDVFVGAGVVLVVRAALVDDVVGAGVVLVVPAAVVDVVVGAGVVLVVRAAVVDAGSGARRRRRDAAGIAAVDHEALKPTLIYSRYDENITDIYLYSVVDV